jgi:predicted nuclease with TOPRIM domain
MATLYELTGQFRELLELVEQGEVDPKMLADTLEGLEGEIEIKADGYAKVIRELEGQASMLKGEIDRLSDRKSSIENNIKAMKESLEMAMRSTGKVKFKTDLFSFNIQKNPARLVITGEVPKDYLIPQEPKVDNKTIKDLLKEKELPFAHLEQSESLRIR